VSRPEIRIVLDGDTEGMGPGATRADAEAFRDFLDSRLTTIYPQCDVTVDLLREGESAARPVTLDETETQDVADVMPGLWEDFCADTALWPSTQAMAS
jgi:hypothetical protein